MTEASVTVVVSVREGHHLAEKSLLTVLADDCVPFELIYLDLMSPPAIAAKIRDLGDKHGFKILRHDQWIAPAAARKLALAQVTTKYVAFVDNDLMVERGCLEKLIACAEDTGAGLVSPLYLQAGGGRATTIHMAGGALQWSEGTEGVLLREWHDLQGAPPEQARGLVRKKIGYTEYHYVLGRMDLLRRPGAISDDVLLVNEHIDLALFAREQGEDAYLEPSAQVTYVAFDSRCLQDAAFFRRRWDVAACEQSLQAFERRWPNLDRAGVTDPMRPYAASRLLEFELRRAGSTGTDLAEVMAPTELAQTRYALREQAIRRGYAENQVRAIETTCDFATLLFDGLYRPDGRPFLNHVIGTASALVRYEVKTGVVLAGLVHSAYSHRPSWMSEDHIVRTLQPIAGLDGLIRRQPAARAFLAKAQIDPLSLTVGEAEVFALLAANEVDMRLAGEYRATHRPLEVAPRGLAMIAAALDPFGIDGLAKTASQPVDGGEAWPLFGAGTRHVSFRLDARNGKLLPV